MYVFKSKTVLISFKPSFNLTSGSMKLIMLQFGSGEEY